jgi:hypothetical protein
LRGAVLAFVPVALLFVPGHGPGASGSPATIRGINLSTHTDGSDWASPGIISTMADIRAVGANWVSIHPYGWIRGDGSVRFVRFDPSRPPEWITRPIREAHAAGLKICIKPHIGYWGSPFSWRGAIRFESDEAWARFFGEYTEWITLLAEACREADGFVVGTELDLTLDHEAEWRRVIRAVREHTTLPLTYAANWTHYRDVRFWDALDVVGIQAYFPLSAAADPDTKTLRASWKAIMSELHAYSREQNRKIVFTELGYNRAHTAPVQPWAYRSDGPDAEEMQARCLRAALEAVEAEPAVLGSFLWKWFPNPHPIGRNFQLATPALKAVIRDVWKPTSVLVSN